MLACVFNQEMLLAGRRRRAHLLRWIYAGLVIVQLTPLFFAAGSFNDWLSGSGFSDFFERFIVLHFGLIALLTPAMVAGAITDEKMSGTLQYLLTAYLSPWEIVLGKLLARSWQLVVMSLAGLPLICLFSGFGGLGELPLALFVLSLALIFGLAAASMLASVWCRHTRDAMLTVYLLGLIAVPTLALSAWPRLVALGDRLLPLRALTLDNGRLDWPRVGGCLLTWSLLGLFCLAVASLRLRGAYLRQLRAAPRVTSRWLPSWRPRMRANPVLWRERHVVGLAPLPWLRRWPRWLGCVFVACVTLASLAWSMQQTLPAGVRLIDHIRQGRWLELRDALRAAPRIADAFYWHGLAALLVATLVVAVRASGCISGEREQHTWQALLQSPLTTRTILRGKQWGILGACLPYLVSFTAVALPVSLLIGAAAAAWTVVWLAATIFAVLYITSVGIWCSARTQQAWRSLLLTLAVGYGSWIALSLPAGLAMALFLGILGAVLDFFDWLFNMTTFAAAIQSIQPAWLILGFGVIAAFWLLTHRLLIAAERQIARRDRARDVDPQFDQFHARWLRQVMVAARAPRPIDPALFEQPLPMTTDAEDEAPAYMPLPDNPVDTDTLLPVPDALNPLRDYNHHV